MSPRVAAFFLVLASGIPAAGAQTAAAGPAVSFSGYLQPQYEVRTRGDTTTDRALFRRLVLTLDATLSEDWSGELQVDLGPVASGDDRPTIKNTLVRYEGWRAHGLTLTIGNQKIPFSRAVLGSSSRRGLIERPFTGDRAFGGPGRAPSIALDGWHRGDTLHWTATLAASNQSPDPGEIRVDGIAEAERGWNEGPLVAGRLEIHPLGRVELRQGDLARGPFRFTIAGAAYRWSNDGDVDAHGAGLVDANAVTGLEASAALRGAGLSVDLEYGHVAAHAVDAGVTLGLYSNGEATADKTSLEAGYMLVPRRLEALAGIEALDTGVYDTPWRRVSLGTNWYIRGHDLKFALMHRESFDDRGVRGARSRTTYLQAQIAF